MFDIPVMRRRNEASEDAVRLRNEAVEVISADFWQKIINILQTDLLQTFLDR